jgi:RNA polymerase sigma factor (sigma-70 family)
MTESAQPSRLEPADFEAHQRFIDLVAEVRPELFRYCARMTGSVFEGEDVVQDTLARAYVALGTMAEPPTLRPWLFRIAHNAAMDFLKRYDRKHVELVADIPDLAESEEPGVDATLLEAALLRFLDLPPVQRSALVLKDVLGHSLVESAETMGTTVPAVKAALVRARANLAGGNGSSPQPARVEISAEDRANLRRYADLFNARDWDALRALMGEETRLEVVARVRRRGAAAAEYYTRYEEIAPIEDLRAEVGTVDGEAVIAVFRPARSAAPAYFILPEWDRGRIAKIRDFRYVPYIGSEGRYSPAED